VDFADLLALTVPQNRHHFDEMWIVTAPHDQKTLHLCQHFRSLGFKVNTVVTDLFYRHGASFNKWAALEYGLDEMGRFGWLCILDADTLWPSTLPHWRLDAGCLYTPYRRMLEHVSLPLPVESAWCQLPRHPQQVEWAGYTQVFHASDPVLPRAPWHATNWRHAGGADSFFQALWPQQRKLRPPFEVLHLGTSGVNWCGRATPYLTGDIDPAAPSRVNQLRQFIHGRRTSLPGTDRYRSEKLSEPAYTSPPDQA